MPAELEMRAFAGGKAPVFFLSWSGAGVESLARCLLWVVLTLGPGHSLLWGSPGPCRVCGHSPGLLPADVRRRPSCLRDRDNLGPEALEAGFVSLA